MTTLSTLSLFDMQFIKDFLTPERITLFIRVILMLAIGLPVISFITRVINRIVKEKLSLQSKLIVTRTIKYSLITLLW